MKTEKFNNLGKIVFKLDSGSSEINVAKNSETIVARIVNPLQHGISNKGVEIYINDVLYAPDRRDNLLSMRKLTDAGLVARIVYGGHKKN